VHAHIAAVNSGARDSDLMRCTRSDNKVMRLIFS